MLIFIAPAVNIRQSKRGTICYIGGIGRHRRLKISFQKWSAGSSPVCSTILDIMYTRSFYFCPSFLSFLLCLLCVVCLIYRVYIMSILQIKIAIIIFQILKTKIQAEIYKFQLLYIM